MKRRLWILFALGVIGIAAKLWRMTLDIERQAAVDEARPADVIVVLGAAEYRGRPSPVLKARLDHALELYGKGLAARVITTGGAGGDPLHTESEVGRKYLSAKGVPVENILIEPESESTAESMTAAAEIMRRMGMKSCIVVTDGYHIFRAKHMLQQLGIEVYGSPRPSSHQDGWGYRWLCFRQAVGFSLWSLGIRI
ncbi:MAG: YdcF family protein [Acidobacteria bacterium]|nr:YdcF family protein [Acidobacteriota bacterium]